MNIAVNILLGVIGSLLMALGFILAIPGIYLIIWETSAGTSFGAYIAGDYYFDTMVSFAECAFVIGLGFTMILWSKPQRSSE